MRKLFIAIVFSLFATHALALSSETTRASFDSTLVASGATWTSAAVRLDRSKELQVFVDNTSGEDFRVLTMNAYADPKCATSVVDSIRWKLAFGTKATGGEFDPGRSRIYIGPNPPSRDEQFFVIYDTTSADNGSITSPLLASDGMTYVGASAVASGGTTTLALFGKDDTSAGANIAPVGATATAALANGAVMGPGAAAGTQGVGNASAAIVPRRIRATTTAAGAGNTVRLLVYGKGKTPGTFNQQMILPLCAKFSLSAANGTIRAWGVER